MSSLDEGEVIDLTNVWVNPPCPSRSRLLNYAEPVEVIDLVDDSFCEETNTSTVKKTNRNIQSKEPKKSVDSTTKNKETKTRKVGECPICREELGTNPLASTKCGHVFCLYCLEMSLKTNRYCPTCRCVLKGKTAYHSLYLDLN